MSDSISKTEIPIVSVLLPVFNGSEYLRESIESILDQTYTDFELILIDDGSTDDSPEIMRQFDDPRIRQYQQENVGLAKTLNRGIELSRGEFIARQDQDDVSLPERLLKQVDFLESNQNCALVGSWAEILDGSNRTERYHKHPTNSSTLKFELLFNNPFVHSSIMIRKGVLERLGGYCTDPKYQPPEDYDLWARIARHYEIANIPEVLLLYREVPQSMSRSGNSSFLLNQLRISSENIAYLASDTPENHHIQNISALTQALWDSVIAPPNFFVMRRILKKAVDKVALPEMRSQVFSTAQNRLLSQMYWYYKDSSFPLRGVLFHLGWNVYLVAKTGKHLLKKVFG